MNGEKTLKLAKKFIGQNHDIYISGKDRIIDLLNEKESVNEKLDFLKTELNSTLYNKLKVDDFEGQLTDPADMDNTFHPVQAAVEQLIEFIEDRISTFEKIKGNNQDLAGINTFDYSGINVYFFDEKIERFKQIENKLIERGYFKNGVWDKEKTILAGLIYLLKEYDYLRPKIEGKDAISTLLSFRYFFEKRYKKTIKKEFQKNRISENIIKAKSELILIIPELKTA